MFTHAYRLTCVCMYASMPHNIPPVCMPYIYGMPLLGFKHDEGISGERLSSISAALCLCVFLRLSFHKHKEIRKLKKKKIPGLPWKRRAALHERTVGRDPLNAAALSRSSRYPLATFRSDPRPDWASPSLSLSLSLSLSPPHYLSASLPFLTLKN